MIVNFDFRDFQRKLNQSVEYSIGFLEGVQSGKKVFHKNLGQTVIEGLQFYIDGNARMDPRALAHVYEWYSVGSPSARLFKIESVVKGSGISISSTFSQSKTIADGSIEPFYNKARIMEDGIPLTIKPSLNSVLVFDVDGETIFTKKEVVVEHPGGPEAQGSYKRVFDEFFSKYFTQSFLRSSGVLDYLENPKVFKKNFKAGSVRGRSEGIKTGYNWIINAKVGVE